MARRPLLIGMYLQNNCYVFFWILIFDLLLQFPSLSISLSYAARNGDVLAVKELLRNAPQISQSLLKLLTDNDPLPNSNGFLTFSPWSTSPFTSLSFWFSLFNLSFFVFTHRHSWLVGEDGRQSGIHSPSLGRAPQQVRGCQDSPRSRRYVLIWSFMLVSIWECMLKWGMRRRSYFVHSSPQPHVQCWDWLSLFKLLPQLSFSHLSSYFSLFSAQTPFHWAAINGNIEMLMLLVENNANINAGISPSLSLSLSSITFPSFLSLSNPYRIISLFHA